MDYVTLFLNDLDQKSRYIAVMNALLIHSSKQAHWKLLEDLLKAMIKKDLKLGLCQLFQATLIYMGNDFVIRGRSNVITPLKSHTEVIQKILTPHTPKNCKSFCGLVYYLSLFCNSLQKILTAITDLTRKSVPFV